MRGFRISGAAVPAALALALAAGPAQAKTIEMTAVGGSPPQVTPVKVTKEVIIPEINRRLAASGKDFTIEWKQAYAGSLAKFTEVLETVEAGIAQFGVQLVAFEESKLPLEQYTAVVPFAANDPLVMVDIDSKVRQQVPEMDQEWLKYKQIRLGSASGEPFALFTTYPVKSIASLKGHKMGASGALAQFMRGMGAVIVNANMANSYTDIKNGVYEGYVITVGLAVPYRTYEAAKHVTEVGFAPAIVPELTVNIDTWKSLPDFVQKIFRDVCGTYGAEAAKVDEKRRAGFIALMKKSHVEFSSFSDEQRANWAKRMPNVAGEWAASLDKKGLPGSKILTAYMNELRARHIKVYRDWDKEMHKM